MSAVATPKADPNDTLDVLVKAREWLTDPAHWTTKAFMRTASGREIEPNERGAIDIAATCGSGAIMLVSGRGRDALHSSAHAALMHVAEEIHGRFTAIPSVNDGPDGYENIIVAYDKAIALERERRGLA